MERFQSPTISSFFLATLLAGAVLLGGCSDSFTGVTPPEAEEEVTVQNPQHNTNGDGTEPVAGHNTSNED